MDRERERTVEDVAELGQEWAAAERRGDAQTLDRLLAADFVGIGPFGFVLTKEQWLVRYTGGALRYDAFALEEVRVRAYGDAAIATGRQTQAGTH